MSAGANYTYKGYRIEARKGFRMAAIFPPDGLPGLAEMATASGEHREEPLLEAARGIIDRHIQAAAGL